MAAGNVHLSPSVKKIVQGGIVRRGWSWVYCISKVVILWAWFCSKQVWVVAEFLLREGLLGIGFGCLVFGSGVILWPSCFSWSIAKGMVHHPFFFLLSRSLNNYINMTQKRIRIMLYMYAWNHSLLCNKMTKQVCIK